MLFKSALIYQSNTTQDWSAVKLQQAAKSKPFRACGAIEKETAGWVPVMTGSDDLVYAINHHRLMRLKVEQKILPAATIREHLQAKIELLERAESRRAGRKERRLLTDDVVFELLPQAFTKSFHVGVWLDQAKSRVIIDTANHSRAEQVLNLLREGLGRLPVVPLRTQEMPRIVMTDWAKHQPPADYELLDNFELMDFESDAVIKCKNQDIKSPEITGHLNAGLYITRQQVRWSGSVTSTITDCLELRGIKYYDSVHEQIEHAADDDPMLEQQTQAFEMTALLERLISSLTKEFGGLA